jgi:large subunit ribosomal protein L21
MSYAIITVGGKQYRVREGERLLVDRLKTDEGKTFTPRVLLVGGDGKTDISPSTTVTARVVGHTLGDKIRIGKYKRRTGYRKHTGFRASLTQIQIESIGAGARKAGAAKPAAEKPVAEKPPAEKPPAEKPAAAKAAPAAAPKAAASARTAHPPKGYEEMTVAEIAENASSWRRPNLEAALEHEQANAKRKGAIAALEAALAEKESH